MNQNTNISGNDFMIDDVTFTTICYDYDTIKVTSVPKPVFTVTPNDTICAGEMSSIIASSTSSNLTYTWNPGNIHSNELNISPSSSTFYSVTAVDTNGCISDLVSRLVYVLPLPTVSIIELADTVCFGDTVYLTASSPTQNLTFIWAPTASTLQQIKDIPLISSQYIVQATNLAGCSGYDTVNIEVIPPLELTFTGNTTICEGDSTILYVAGNIPSTQFVWENTTAGSQTIVAPTNSTYIHVTGTYLNCPQTIDSILIVVITIPSIQLPLDVQICKGETIQTTVGATPSSSTIHWISLGETTGTTQTFTSVDDQYILVYADNGGCVSAIDSFFIDVLLSCNITVPNVFTPNNDGVNDGFSLLTIDGIESLNCVIVNRWGNVIKRFDQPNFVWDGKDANGHAQAEGVYFYRINGFTSGGEEIQQQGFVSLER
ncbi:MAG: gliding motility-associated C-terminal domain-containing protein [Crocinitomicaceae bacterium]|nr:gliding motility-associated C-terminal domain-containing protein [Crocinitomicaceae bacterium]